MSWPCGQDQVRGPGPSVCPHYQPRESGSRNRKRRENGWESECEYEFPPGSSVADGRIRPCRHHLGQPGPALHSWVPAFPSSWSPVGHTYTGISCGSYTHTYVHTHIHNGHPSTTGSHVHTTMGHVLYLCVHWCQWVTSTGAHIWSHTRTTLHCVCVSQPVKSGAASPVITIYYKCQHADVIRYTQISVRNLVLSHPFILMIMDTSRYLFSK